MGYESIHGPVPVMRVSGDEEADWFPLGILLDEVLEIPSAVSVVRWHSSPEPHQADGTGRAGPVLSAFVGYPGMSGSRHLLHIW